MAQPARTLSTSTEPTEPQRMSTDDTGRFAIDSSERGTMLPPGEDGAAEVLSLEELGGSLIESPPRTAPPPPPPVRAAAPVSGVFRSGETDVDVAFAERIISLSPIYTPAETAQGERAVLEIEDLSLRPDNPYLASSLVPPTGHGSSRGKLLAVGAAVLALLGGGAAWYSSPRVPAPVARARTSAMQQGHHAAASSAPALAAPMLAQTAETAVPAPVAPAAASPVEPAALPAAPPLKPTPAKARVVASASPVPALVAPAPASAVAPGSAVVPAASEAGTAQPAVPAVDESLPALPTREQVVAGFDSVRPQLEQCAAGQHGVASVAATVASSGRVSYALVQGKFAGTPEGSCMALAVRQAHFPRFSQASLKVVYPFSL